MLPTCVPITIIIEKKEREIKKIQSKRESESDIYEARERVRATYMEQDRERVRATYMKQDRVTVRATYMEQDRERE